ncbi:hypothetical protein Q31b_34360 [Novipirellula aureliae]|uniref:Uncharacterized protein n=1 Tax=Novipirellula aureliae TaxID=2527966 RepID=A0A5C6DTS4_9BACT|nr:hypothetical protein Q31b_34360 [Novipirellula aureliae]
MEPICYTYFAIGSLLPHIFHHLLTSDCVVCITRITRSPVGLALNESCQALKQFAFCSRYFNFFNHTLILAYGLNLGLEAPATTTAKT